jgi:hypothetical protein
MSAQKTPTVVSGAAVALTAVSMGEMVSFAGEPICAQQTVSATYLRQHLAC